ncbi:MAG: PIG-L family deacetylase, partial [Patescibacteria group bacterium]
MNVLVIAPHHDDEVIGCGGSIVLHADRGDVVAVAYVTQGWSGIPTVQDRDTAIRQIRAEAFEAGQILGVAHT